MKAELTFCSLSFVGKNGSEGRCYIWLFTPHEWGRKTVGEHIDTIGLRTVTEHSQIMYNRIQRTRQKKAASTSLLWWKAIEAIWFENSSCPEIENENWLCVRIFDLNGSAIMALKKTLLNWISSAEFQLAAETSRAACGGRFFVAPSNGENQLLVDT